jgi:hypothetical protein
MYMFCIDISSFVGQEHWIVSATVEAMVDSQSDMEKENGLTSSFFMCS